jgi:hypothetical protein
MLNHGNTLSFNNQNKILVKKTSLKSKEKGNFSKLEILKEFENGIKKNRTFNQNIHIYNQELKKLDNIEKKYLKIEGKANEEDEECQDFISKRGSSTESDETFFKNLSGSKNFH